jgi:RNA polymerase sigma-70 factor (ECF subfamily)
LRDATFDALLRQHVSAVHAYARALTRDPWTAEDVAQETLLRAWKYLDTYSARGSFEGWLLRICRNCVIDMAARESKYDKCVELEDVAVFDDEPGDVYDLLSHLPLVHREVIVLCRVLGYDYESAATILEVPVGTVRSRLNRARDGLDQLLRAAQEVRGA